MVSSEAEVDKRRPCDPEAAKLRTLCSVSVVPLTTVDQDDSPHPHPDDQNLPVSRASINLSIIFHKQHDIRYKIHNIILETIINK